MENISRIYLRLVSRARRKEEIPPPSTNQANAVHVSSDDSIILNRVRFIIAFFFSSRYIRIYVRRERGARSLSTVPSLFHRCISCSREKWKLDIQISHDSRVQGRIEGGRETSRYRGSVPSFEEVCSIVLERRGRGKEKMKRSRI